MKCGFINIGQKNDDQKQTKDTPVILFYNGMEWKWKKKLCIYI